MNTQDRINKTLFVVRALPYESAGTPVIIRNLLKNLPNDSFFVLGRRPHPKKRLMNDIKQKMFQIPMIYVKGHRLWKYLSILPGLIIGGYVIKRYKITNIVGVFQDDASLILSLVLSYIFPSTNYFPYFLDLYAEQKDGFSIKIASRVQRKVFNRSNCILVANDGLNAFYKKTYNNKHKFETLPFTVNQSDISLINADLAKENRIQITFAGSVNNSRLQTLKVFTKLVKEDPRFQFNYITSNSELFLRKKEVFFDGFKMQFINDQELLIQELSKSDLLYLPMSFEYPIKQEKTLMTSFGAKVFDYLAASVPILVHMPDTFYNYKFFEESESAHLLNSLDEKQILDFLNYAKSDQFKIDSGNYLSRIPDLICQFSGDTVSRKLINLLEEK